MTGDDGIGSKKKILIIDFFYPPAGGGGVRRTLGWVRYLRRHQWSPIVLTVRSGDCPFQDPSLHHRVPPETPVHRVPSVDPLRLAKKVLRRRPAQSDSGQGAQTTYHLDWLRGLAPWMLFPDSRLAWVLPAIAKGIALLRSEEIDVLYSTYSNAIAAHFIAYALKTISGKPWVADFQDPWSEGYVSYFPTVVHHTIACRIEEAIIKKSDHIIVTTRAVKQVYENKYRLGNTNRISVIPNGFDHELFATHAPAPRRSSFKLTHFGVFWGSRSPVPFLMGLAQAMKVEPRFAAHAEVQLVGGFEPRHRRAAQRLLKSLDLQRTVHLLEFMPYADGVRKLLDSDVLLLVLDNTDSGKHLVPAKLSDYLGAGKPILALAPEGEAARVVREANAGVVVDPDDIDAVAGAIIDLYTQWQGRGPGWAIQDSYAQRFSYQEITKSFVAVLNGITTAPTTPNFLLGV